MSDSYFSRGDISRMLGLKASAVATLCSMPGFPEPVIVNARVYRYPAVEVEAFLARLRAGQVASAPRVSNRRPVSAPAVKVNWVVDVSRRAPKHLTKV